MKDNTIQIRMSEDELDRLTKAVLDTIQLEGRVFTRADIIRAGLMLYYERLDDELLNIGKALDLKDV